MSTLLYSLFFLLAQATEIVCALGPNASSYNAYSDQRPTGDAMQLAGRVNAALVSACRPNCPTVAMFRNPTAPNIMVIKTPGQAKMVYKPEFLTAVYEAYGDGGILAILAHEVGHMVDSNAAPLWMKREWSSELRADAWAGCAFGRMKLTGRPLQAAMTTLSKYPSASHPAWTVRSPVVREGYKQCGGIEEK